MNEFQSSTLATQEEVMGQETYTVLVPKLVKKLEIGAMDLVRNCNIAVRTAYEAIDEENSKKISLDSCWKIYLGLKKEGIKVDGRPIRFSDIVDLDE